MNAEQLRNLVGNWQSNQEYQDISGILLYSDDHIVQVLEGESDKVHRLYQQIAEDRRHQDVATLGDGPVARRAFQEWNLGFLAIDANEHCAETSYQNAEQLRAELREKLSEWPDLAALLQEFLARQLVGVRQFVGFGNGTTSPKLPA